MKHSCESILESFVSRFENHFDVRRNVNEDTSNKEFTITCNGPNLANCNGVVREAMEDYWRSKGSSWHFLCASVLEQLTQEKESTEENVEKKEYFAFLWISCYYLWY